jgi:hypothetical protein
MTAELGLEISIWEVVALGEQRQVSLCRFEASLEMELQDNQGHIEKPCLKNTTKEIRFNNVSL